MGELRVKLNSARSLRNSSGLLNNANALLDRTWIPMLVILYNVLFFSLTDLVEVRHNALSFYCCYINVVSEYINSWLQTESNQNPLKKCMVSSYTIYFHRSYVRKICVNKLYKNKIYFSLSNMFRITAHLSSVGPLNLSDMNISGSTNQCVFVVRFY